MKSKDRQILKQRLREIMQTFENDIKQAQKEVEEILKKEQKSEKRLIDYTMNLLRLQKLNMKNGSRRPFKHTRKSLQGRGREDEGRGNGKNSS